MDEIGRQQTLEVSAPLPARPRTPRIPRLRTLLQRPGAFRFHATPEGWCRVAVSDQRTRNDRAEQIRKPFDKDFPDRRFTLVPDNPDTHSLGSLYETFPPGKAWHIASWVTLVFTPPYGSRLNMAETGIDARSRQCLDRRVPDRATLEPGGGGLAGGAQR